MAEPKLSIRGLGKIFRTDRGETEALKGVDLDIGDNEFVALVGTSGCGKSTLLSIAAGLDTQTAGSIAIDGAPITAPGSTVAWSSRPIRCCPGSPRNRTSSSR